MNHSSAGGLLRVTCYVLILLATIFALIIIYLSQLDLNDYRISLERTLSSALKQPVQIGHSSLTFNRGFALALKDLQIGEERAPLAEIPQITATLKLAPLFKGRFILDQVQIDNPTFQIRLPFPERPTKGTSQQLLNTLGIRILSVHDASIEVYQTQGDEAEQPLLLSHLNVVLRGWKPEKTGELVISGQLQEQGGRFLFETRLPSSRDPEIWRNEEQKAQLEITNYSIRKFPKLHTQLLPEVLNLTLKVQGVPATGTSFNTTLSNPDHNEQVLSLSGRWTSSRKQESITKLKGELFNIPLSGEIYFIRQVEKYFLAGQLGAKNVVLTPETLKTWKIPNADKFINGDLDQLSITVEKSWLTAELFSALPHMGAKIVISNLDWDLPELNQFQDLTVGLSLEDKNLDIKDGTLVYGGQLIDFSGTINSLFLQPKIDCQFSMNTDINDVQSQFKLPGSWNLSGNIPSTLRLTGLLKKPEFLLQADLDSLDLQFGSLFHKQQTDKSRFKLQGRLDNHRLQFDRFSLNLNDAKIAGYGYVHSDKQEQEYSFTAEPINLDKIKPFSALLEKFQVQGEIEPKLTQQKAGLQGVLKLKDVGAHLTSVIADLNKTTGEIHLDQHGFTFKDLKASLGKSNFVADGIFSDWKNPKLALDLSGKEVRAHDLIFSNQELILYDLKGRLRIDADGITFAPVKVRLEDDTLATVNGEVSNFRNPQISLDIAADRVDVLDIINLFKRPDPENFEKENNGRRPPLRIKASAKQGTLGGLQFQEAEAIIRTEGKRLTIFPLKFNSGKGWCETRIEIDHGDKTAPLKVSGHVEGINASILHQDLFKRRGLISGLLKGDFYLEGNPEGNNFLQNSKGGAHIQISEGTLRKFHGLAQVFSLLNVSQIFAGKLPDMDKDGMPFSLLEGSFQIGAGQVQTEDLKITSEAMNLSAVGSQSMSDDSLNFTLGVMPLRTVDKVITSIPIAGWVLAGEDKALITAHFRIEGTSENPKVTPVPIDSVSKTVFGIFKRTFGLPGKLVKDIGTLFEKEAEKKK